MIDVSTQIAYWYVDVQPPITDDSVVTFDLNVSIIKNYNQPGEGTIIDAINVVQNNVVKYPSSTSSLTTTLNRPYCSPYETVNVSNSQIYSLQFSKNIAVSGTSTSILQITDGQVGSNGCVTNLDQTILTSVSTSVIDGCTCCTITDDDIPQGIQNHNIQYGQNNYLPLAYTAVISGVGNSQSEACADYGNYITRYINGPIFQEGISLYGGNPLHPSLLTGYSYCTNGSGLLYELNNGMIGQEIGYSCSSY